jgi:hypothetical protein
MLVFLNVSFPSVLSEAAARLNARQWTMLSLNNPTLGALDLHYSLLYWNDSGVWDPVKRKVRWVGGPGTCCANPADYKMITYDEATDVWALNNTPFSGSGHAYDANAFNPGAGLHYFGLIGSSTLRSYNDVTWSSLPDAPFSATTPSLTWFPDINNGQGGLVFHGDNGRIAWYNGSSWATVSSVSLSSYNSFSQYNPVYKGVWLGGCGSRSNWFLDTSLTTRRLADAPVSMGNGSTMETCDPVSGNFLMYDRNAEVWYELDMKTDNWSQINNMTPSFALNSAFHVPISEYGVILVFNHASSAKTAYLYKHSPFTAVESKAPAPVPRAVISVMPNPFYGTTTITANGHPRMAIYNIHGKLIAKYNSGNIRWNASGLPAGIYLIRATIGKRVLEARAILLK